MILIPFVTTESTQPFSNLVTNLLPGIIVGSRYLRICWMCWLCWVLSMLMMQSCNWNRSMLLWCNRLVSWILGLWICLNQFHWRKFLGHLVNNLILKFGYSDIFLNWGRSMNPDRFLQFDSQTREKEAQCQLFWYSNTSQKCVKPLKILNQGIFLLQSCKFCHWVVKCTSVKLTACVLQNLLPRLVFVIHILHVMPLPSKSFTIHRQQQQTTSLLFRCSFQFKKLFRFYLPFSIIRTIKRGERDLRPIHHWDNGFMSPTMIFILSCDFRSLMLGCNRNHQSLDRFMHHRERILHGFLKIRDDLLIRIHACLKLFCCHNRHLAIWY